jgi:hypothetical protein
MVTVRDVLFLSGDLFLPKPLRTFLETYHVGNDRSLLYITNWSLVHVVSGFLLAWILVERYQSTHPYWVGFQIHTAWEIWQLVVRNTPWTLRGFLDVGMDTLLFMLGMAGFLLPTYR